MNIEIRHINPSDYLKISKLIQRTIKASAETEALAEKLSQTYTEEYFVSKENKIDFFVAEDRETSTLLGIIGLKSDVLRGYYVDPNFQGKGVGRKLFDYLEDEARSRGLNTLHLTASPKGQPIYEHFGFKLIKKVENEIEGQVYIDALMEKSLD